MISDKARSISERVYELVEEYDDEFKVWDEILLCLVGDHIVNVPAEERDRRLAKFKEDLDRYVDSFIKI
jgi:hypothetical protein